MTRRIQTPSKHLDRDVLPGLQWHVLEIGDKGWAPRGFETLACVPRHGPLPAAPATLTTVEFRMQPDGSVRWRFAGADGPTGVFER